MKLPKKPSALLRLALSDISKVRRDRKYVIDMNQWHNPSGGCHVCLSGAVMVRTLCVAADKYAQPYNGFFSSGCLIIGGWNGKALLAIDELRDGEISSAISRLGYSIRRFEKSGLPVFVETPKYTDENYKDWRRSLLRLARQLEDAGY